MFKVIDNFLDKITMYRLVLYGLICILVVSVIFGFFNILPYTPGGIIFTTSFLIFICIVTNGIFSNVFEAPTNIESAYITALILALIITPFKNINDLPFLAWAGVLAMSSKYILTINRKHIFNPVAISVALTGLWLGDYASWWVGTKVMAPFVLILGLLIIRKLRREYMVFTFFAVAILTEAYFAFINGANIGSNFSTLIVDSSFLFFAFVMLTEPLTTPPTKKLQMFYGGFVGFLFSPYIHIGTFYLSPEIALITGNIFSYLVSSKQKLYLHIKEKIKYGTDTVEFIFQPTSARLSFSPGQYLEWTLPHDDPDSRGNRRYFTIASSPTEESLHLGVKFYPQGSSFKRTLSSIDEKKVLSAGSLAGDFTLPENTKEKLVFIAGGIGVTPFRSMVKYCIDMKQNRDIVLLYSNKFVSDVAFADIFEEARKFGIKTIYILSEEKSVPHDWKGMVGRITPELIQQQIPDYKERMYYLSGPHAMVTAFEDMIRKMGIHKTRIKRDFFPGFV